MTVFEVARSHLLESQLRPNKITDDRVLNAFASIRRELFVPEHLRLSLISMRICRSAAGAI